MHIFIYMISVGRSEVFGQSLQNIFQSYPLGLQRGRLYTMKLKKLLINIIFIQLQYAKKFPYYDKVLK